MRMARELVAGGQLQPMAAVGSAADQGAGADFPASETVLWSHPLVRKACTLTELVVRKGWHEGRSPRTVAGERLVLLLCGLSTGGVVKDMEAEDGARIAAGVPNCSSAVSGGTGEEEGSGGRSWAPGLALGCIPVV